MNATPAGFSSNRHWTSTRRSPLARTEPQRSPTLADLVEWGVRRGYQSDAIFRGAERAFPPPDRTPAGQRGYREEIARLIVRYRHGGGRRGAG
ncbi:MAG: hypothetical protein P9E67_10935 [Candidatus Competibacter sp.]|nr:hypothetical protein [Candidatus Competibacter sp.]